MIPLYIPYQHKDAIAKRSRQQHVPSRARSVLHFSVVDRVPLLVAFAVPPAAQISKRLCEVVCAFHRGGGDKGSPTFRQTAERLVVPDQNTPTAKMLTLSKAS